MSQFCGVNDKKVYRLVLIGGPYGGKTTGQSRLSTFFESLGWRVYRVPQVLSAITGAGLRESDTSMSQEAAYRLNENLLKLIIQVEDTFYEMASSATDNCLVISDGGTIDIRARLSPHQWDRLLQANGWNDVTLRDSRYNQVIHMVSLPVAGSGEMVADSFSTTATDLKTQDAVVSQAWVGHPYYDVVDNSTDFDTKISRMISVVCFRLNIQIGDRLAVDSRKRKFHVCSLPKDEVFPPFQDFTVVHDYLASPNQKMQARVRRRGQNDNWTYTHTVRHMSDTQSNSSSELKILISPREYDLLLAQKDAQRFTVFKTRRCFLWNNQYFQLDIYEDPCPPQCQGLILLETYTALKGDDFEVPSFLNVLGEVTGDPAFSMYNLSGRLDKHSPRDGQVHSHGEPGGSKAAEVVETVEMELELQAGQEEHKCQ